MKQFGWCARHSIVPIWWQLLRFHEFKMKTRDFWFVFINYYPYQWCLLGCLLCLARLSVINWCLFWCSVGCAIFSLICIPFWGANITYKNVYLWLMYIVYGSFFIVKINIFDSCVCSNASLDLCVKQKHQIKVFAICPAIWLAWNLCVCMWYRVYRVPSHNSNEFSL